jgi:hypothetical protein
MRLFLFLLALLTQASFAEDISPATYFDQNKDTVLGGCTSNWKPDAIGARSLGEMSVELDSLIRNKASKAEIDLSISKLQYFAKLCAFSQVSKEKSDAMWFWQRFMLPDSIDALQGQTADEWDRVRPRCTPSQSPFAQPELDTQCSLAMIRSHQIGRVFMAVGDIADGDWARYEKHVEGSLQMARDSIEEDRQKLEAERRAGPALSTTGDAAR